MDFENKLPESKYGFYHLEVCCRYVGEIYGRPNISEWTNRDYIKLSGVLSRQTDVQISPNTLKRIFGKLKTTERYYPQKATRDTLARYAGYQDWEMFVQKHPRPDILDKEIEKVPEAIVLKAEHAFLEINKRKKRWPLFVGSIAAVTILLFLVLNNIEKNVTSLAGVRLICNNPEGTNPHSAIFKLHLPSGFQGDANNFTLNFGDGRTSKSINSAKFVTHYYEVPGRYYAVLSYGGSALDTVSVYLKTDGWTATANLQTDSVRVYPLPVQSLFKAHKMTVNTLELLHAGVDTNRTFFVHFVNATPMAINGDNFELTTYLVTSGERPGVRCSQVNITIFGEKAKHAISVMKPGCSSFNGFRLSENNLSGESEDLSALGKDLTMGGRCKLQVTNRQGILWINDKQVYKAGYKVPIGKIYGLEIVFSGIGEVNSVAIRDLKTGKTFEGIF